MFPLSSSAQITNHCSVYLNSVLHAGADDPPWLSPSQEFAFGFRLLRNDDDDEEEDLFLLSIWFNKIPGKTIVWSKNDHPVPEGSTIQLTTQGLTLSSKGKEIWTITSSSSSSTCASMLDSGNFVLLNGEDSTTPIWESFANPTDTILPSQTLRAPRSLTCRQSETNYADGRFQLRMQEDGDLVLYSLLLPTRFVTGRYWASRTQSNNATSSSSQPQLVFDAAGYIYIQQGKLNIHNITKSKTERELLQGSKHNYYYMARLDFDGVFRLYNHPTRDYVVDAMSCTSLWSVVQTTPDDVCRAISSAESRGIGSGACGYNSFCVSSNGKPSCFCPEGYSLLDPLDTYKGCKPDFPLPSCHRNGWETTSDLVDFKELNNTDFRLTDYEHQIGSQVDRETCIDFCRRDCFCAAVVYNGNNCWKKRFPLSNGRQSPTVNRTVFIKVPKNNVTSFCPHQGKNQSTVIIVVSALLGSSVFLNILLLMAIAIATFLVYHKKLLNLQAASSSTVNGMRVYTYKELEEATGGFKEHLGRGSFGTVYKGVVPSIPRRFIAVKRLGEAEKQGEKEFTAEVNTIGQTHHKNLVKLLGYCNEGTHRLLVYEYMSNGSLAGLLFGLSRPHWNQRKLIAFGIARGLTYLHEECSTQIIHCDIKPQNILLDEHFTPKISDFGLAKLLLSEQSRAALTNIRGTIGYFSPEWFRKASITVKVDVYSFGVMLLEIICCMSSVMFALGDQEEALIDWAYDCYREKRLDKLVENDEEARNDMKSVERVVMVGIWCVQEDPCLRPSMRRVTQMLEGIADVSIPPRPTFFSSFSSIAFRDLADVNMSIKLKSIDM
ncbi:hypothetical protein C2S52_004215 [Perilla frutescens var. hirtella]|nr:hypothetical protein C2S51_011345 [Perilla frutescens var. frutescens]KAH6793738.1 hypothetical protein C2S52_004215 [Perilla frutescens var. hirtella]